MPDGVLLATLVLNEMEFLPRLWEQHRDWPGLRKWIFVEACDTAFAAANPGCATSEGLSTDGTTEFLARLATEDPRVTHVRYGWADGADPALRKIGPRNAYWLLAEAIEPEFVVQIDADEMYTRRDQDAVVALMNRRDQRQYDAWTIPKREIWRPPSIAHLPLLTYEAVEGFWKLPCCHWFRWAPGTGHRACHVTPQRADGTYLNDRINTLHDKEWIDPDGKECKRFVMPQMLHLGFAASVKTRRAKADYYARRGEEQDEQRQWYVESREAWFAWKPGDALPHGAWVIPYAGPIPEVLAGETG